MEISSTQGVLVVMLAALWSASGCSQADDAPDERGRLDADVIAQGPSDASAGAEASVRGASDAGVPAVSAPRADASSVLPAEDATAGGTMLTDAATDLSLAIYDPQAFPRFDLELPDASLAALNLVENAEDERQNTYVRGTLRYGAEMLSEIGVRLKGEGSFQKLDKKPALKLKFDEFVANQSFHGLRRMTLNNAFEDPSFVAERLAYDVFRAAGLPAPRCNNATLYINGAFYGVYVNVEAEDKTFLRRWFHSDDGNLYEEGQKDFVPGAETAFNLETNEKENDRTHLSQLIAAIQAASNDATFLDDIATHLDTKQFLRFTAAEASVNQWDMYGYTVFYVNNLRLYDDPTLGKFVFIPWGMDMSMKPFRDTRKPYISLFTLAREGDRPSARVSAGLLLQRCLKSAGCKAAYAAALREIIDVYEGLQLPARAMSYYEQIREQVMLDPRKNVCCQGGKLSSAQFEAGFQSVLTTIRGRVAAMRADLSMP